MNAEYTIAAVLAPAAVIVLEMSVLRTGLLRTGRYWATVVLVLAFQVPVDGALTAGHRPVVSYRASAISGVRILGAIPIEDFAFGFALVTLTLMLWVHRQARERGVRG